MRRKRHYPGWILTALLALSGIAGISNTAIAAGDYGEEPGLPQALSSSSGISLSGFIDTSAIYNKNGTTDFTSGTSSRAYDRGANSLNLQMLELAIAKEPTEGLGGKAVLNAGPDANVNHAYPMDKVKSYFDIQQGYVSYQHGGAKLEVGKFTTLIGPEVIESPDNWNFSRSWGFEFGPYTHTGARFSYSPNDKVGLTVGVNNGWDVLTAARSQKSVEAQVIYKPINHVYLSVQATNGQEPAQGNYGAASTLYGNRTLIDTVESWDINDSVSLMLDAAYGEQRKAVSLAPGATGLAQTVKWWYIIPYLNYHISQEWRLALRAQYFNDRDGFRTGVAQKMKAGTITLAYAPNKFSEVRVEYRYDKSNTRSFQTRRGAALPKNNQSSASLEFIYKL